MNRKISVGMAVSIVILAMTVTFSITMLVAMRLFDSTVSSVKEKESMYNKIAEVDRYVRSNDYYPIDETTLYDRLTAGYLLGTGDKYARYFSATAYTELMNTQNGTLIGIGVELAVDQSGYAKVIKVYDESPAKEAGIQVGNYITAVDGTDVKSMSSVDAIQTRLRGESGTTVNVTWLDSEAAEHTADLTHSGYSSTTVDYQMVQGNVGYIRIRQFDSTTPSELDYAIRSLSANGAGSLVFDLRDNGGGLLDDPIQCIDLIAPEGTLAFAEDKNGTQTLLGTSASESRIGLPVVCLVNGSTASAAELFASSLRTLNGARLVGTTTQEPLTVVSDINKMFVYFSMNEKQLLALTRQKDGSVNSMIGAMPEVQLQLADGTMYPAKGKIETLSGVIDLSTGAVQMRATFPNAQRLLRSGGTGTVLIPSVLDSALLIPQSATYEVQDKKFVYVLGDSSKVKNTEITVFPLDNGKQYVVTSGLKPGEQVVVEGVATLRDGMPIQPITPEQSAAKVQAMTQQMQQAAAAQK